MAVGKEIRWADLIALKEEFSESQQQQRESSRAASRDTSRSRVQDIESDEDHSERAHGYRVCLLHPFLPSPLIPWCLDNQNYGI